MQYDDDMIHVINKILISYLGKEGEHPLWSVVLFHIEPSREHNRFVG